MKNSLIISALVVGLLGATTFVKAERTEEPSAAHYQNVHYYAPTAGITGQIHPSAIDHAKVKLAHPDAYKLNTTYRAAGECNGYSC